MSSFDTWSFVILIHGFYRVGLLRVQCLMPYAGAMLCCARLQVCAPGLSTRELFGCPSRGVYLPMSITFPS